MNDRHPIPSQLKTPDQELLNNLLLESAARHTHLCPRQVLGIRLGLSALLSLKMIGPEYRPRYRNLDKRLLTIVETDGCGADGVAIATGCSIGHRTLRVVDFGKLAATLVDTKTDKAVRVVPTAASRQLATQLMPEVSNRWNAYLQAYQVMPDADLINIQEVRLSLSIAEIFSKPTSKAICSSCGEEILNEREIYAEEGILCRYCAGAGYYEPAY